MRVWSSDPAAGSLQGQQDSPWRHSTGTCWSQETWHLFYNYKSPGTPAHAETMPRGLLVIFSPSPWLITRTKCTNILDCIEYPVSFYATYLFFILTHLLMDKTWLFLCCSETQKMHWYFIIAEHFWINQSCASYHNSWAPMFLLLLWLQVCFWWYEAPDWVMQICCMFWQDHLKICL